MPQADIAARKRKIARYAFEYARRNNRKKVTCFTKDSIMKMTDGTFHRAFDEVGSLYPEIEKEHWIVDIGAAKMADTPEAFDVILMPNLYGDILSDVAAQIAGSVGWPARPTSAIAARCSRRFTDRLPDGPDRISPTPRACFWER